MALIGEENFSAIARQCVRTYPSFVSIADQSSVMELSVCTLNNNSRWACFPGFDSLIGRDWRIHVSHRYGCQEIICFPSVTSQKKTYKSYRTATLAYAEIIPPVAFPADVERRCRLIPERRLVEIVTAVLGAFPERLEDILDGNPLQFFALWVSVTGHDLIVLKLNKTTIVLNANIPYLCMLY